MKIRVLARMFFEKIKGTPTEVELLEKSKIISINSSCGVDDTPPFSPELLNHPHLLTLTFDDICSNRKLRKIWAMLQLTLPLARFLLYER